uniref:Uncharacterized protein n=1 Tax=Oryza glumipatula TaxID=40148 RepID=A0A0D9Z9B3_9ORYZ
MASSPTATHARRVAEARVWRGGLRAAETREWRRQALERRRRGAATGDDSKGAGRWATTESRAPPLAVASSSASTRRDSPISLDGRRNRTQGTQPHLIAAKDPRRAASSKDPISASPSFSQPSSRH